MKYAKNQYDSSIAVRLLTLYDQLRNTGKIKNQRDFAENFGLSPSFFTEIKKGRSGISVNRLQNITEDYLEYKDWLITGNNSPFSSGESEFSSDKTPRKNYPLIPIEAVAGYGTGENNIIYEECEQYQIPIFEEKGMEFLIRVSGSSMYPKYSNGDILACRKIREILFFQWGKVYVIDSSQGQLVKRIFEDKENPDNIICVSENKEDYPPFSMPKDDIRSLSIVLGVVRME